jgi:hypothetical protein
MRAFSLADKFEETLVTSLVWTVAAMERWFGRVGFAVGGLVLTLSGFFSYFILAVRCAALRDVPWINLPLVVAGAIIAIAGARAAWRPPRGWLSAIGASCAAACACLVAIVFLYYTEVLSYRQPSGLDSPPEGQHAPPLAGLTAHGEQYDLSREQRPVVIVFFRGVW